MRFIFVLNRNAGRGDANRIEERLRREFTGHDIRLLTTPPSRELITAGDEPVAVVAAGGDGTVQAVLRAVGHPIPCPIGILPLGTANDLARTAGIPTGIRDACAVLRAGHTRRFDLLEVNGIPFATAGGIGFPADVAARAERARAAGNGGNAGNGGGTRHRPDRAGRATYFVSALKEIARGRTPIEVRLDAGAASQARSVAAVVVNNTRFMGGFQPSPNADPRDGEMDLFVIGRCTRSRLLWIVSRCFLGKPASCGEVVTACRRRLSFMTSRPVLFIGDGEPLLRATRFEIRVRPRALPLLSPPPAARWSHGKG